MVDHAVDDGSGDDGVAEIVTELFKVNVRSEECGRLAVAAVDDLEEEGGVASVVLLQAIEAELIDEQDVGGGVLPELPGQALVSESGEQAGEHVGRGGVATAIELGAGDEEQRLGEVALAGAGVAGEHETLFAGHEVEAGELEDLGLVDAGLKIEVEIGEQLAFGDARLSDAPFDAPLGAGLRLDGKESFQELGGRQRVLGRVSELGVKSLADLAQIERVQVGADAGQGLLFLHRPAPG